MCFALLRAYDLFLLNFLSSQKKRKRKQKPSFGQQSSSCLISLLSTRPNAQPPPLTPWKRSLDSSGWPYSPSLMLYHLSLGGGTHSISTQTPDFIAFTPTSQNSRPILPSGGAHLHVDLHACQTSTPKTEVSILCHLPSFLPQEKAAKQPNEALLLSQSSPS